MGIDDTLIFDVGDLVTRDGTDVHRVIRADDGYGAIRVLCVKAPVSGWCKVGDIEDNLSGRYKSIPVGDTPRNDM